MSGPGATSGFFGWRVTGAAFVVAVFGAGLAFSAAALAAAFALRPARAPVRA